MTAPTLPTTVGPLGPGVLKIGQTGTLIDASCLLNNARLNVSKTGGDPVYKLCGQSRPGSITYAWTLDGNIDADIADQSGVVALSWSAQGTLVDYEFTPNNDLGVKYTGQLTIDPLSVGADEYGTIMASDFTWGLSGEPTVTYPAP